jgi:hypothetical protein
MPIQVIDNGLIVARKWEKVKFGGKFVTPERVKSKK